MTEDVGFYVELAREADGPIVELAVGTGRVAVPIARETGMPVIGIDCSPAMLALARERCAGLPLELRLGDMREFELDEPADLRHLPVPLAAPPAGLAGPPPRVRARRRASPRRPVRVQRLRFEPRHRRGAARRRVEQADGRRQLDRLRPVRQPRRAGRDAGDETLGVLRLVARRSPSGKA